MPTHDCGLGLFPHFAWMRMDIKGVQTEKFLHGIKQNQFVSCVRWRNDKYIYSFFTADQNRLGVFKCILFLNLINDVRWAHVSMPRVSAHGVTYLMTACVALIIIVMGDVSVVQTNSMAINVGKAYRCSEFA